MHLIHHKVVVCLNGLHKHTQIESRDHRNIWWKDERESVIICLYILNKVDEVVYALGSLCRWELSSQWYHHLYYLLAATKRQETIQILFEISDCDCHQRYQNPKTLKTMCFYYLPEPEALQFTKTEERPLETDARLPKLELDSQISCHTMKALHI